MPRAASRPDSFFTNLNLAANYYPDISTNFDPYVKVLLREIKASIDKKKAGRELR
jgi:hypothetical protein